MLTKQDKTLIKMSGSQKVPDETIN